MCPPGCSPAAAAFAKWLQSLDLPDCAELLLGAEETAAGWARAVPSTTAASFVRMIEADVPTVFTPPPADSSFKSIATLSLPDNPPRRGAAARASLVHRFVMREECARPLNSQLRQDAVHSARSFSGSSISNVGGYHSQARRFDGTEGTPWYAAVHRVLTEALRALHGDAGELESVPIENLESFGWMNVSAPSAFNKLHDHGAVPYSAVYFVDSGGEDSLSQPTLPNGWQETRDSASGRFYYHSASTSQVQWERPSACGGELLLQTQLKAWTNDFAFLPIHPAPGTLWLFPGYMPHAVLPRAWSSDQDSLRISVACNVSSFVEGKNRADLPAVWQASRME